MRTKKYIQVLLENGIKSSTILNLNLSQIKVLAKRFINQKLNEEVKQTVTNVVYDPNNPTDQKNLAQKGIHIDPSTKKISMTLGSTGEMKEDNQDFYDDNAEERYTGQEGPHDETSMSDDGMDDDSGNNRKMMGMSESELNEKFESKAQQGLFWAKCNNSTGKTKEKWCKMAKEFSDSTSKKQYKNMPEKKHKEKTVKKKTTKESYEKFLEDRIVEMMDNHINPAMTKGKLIQSVNERKNSEPFMLRQPKKNSMFSQDEGKEMKTMKRPIGRMFSMGGEMAENTKEKTRTKPDTDTDKREKDKDKDRKNPFEPKHRPAPKARKEFKEQTVAPSRPKTKPDTDTDKGEKDKGRKNPFEPKHRPKPKAEKEIPNWLSWNKLGVKLK
jgi:hypothetical protein